MEQQTLAAPYPTMLRNEVLGAWRACAAAPSTPDGWALLRDLLLQLPLTDSPRDSLRSAVVANLDLLISSGNHLCPVDRSYFHQKLFRLLW